MARGRRAPKEGADLYGCNTVLIQNSNTLSGRFFEKVCLSFVINTVRNNTFSQTHMKSAIIIRRRNNNDQTASCQTKEIRRNKTDYLDGCESAKILTPKKKNKVLQPYKSCVPQPHQSRSLPIKVRCLSERTLVIAGQVKHAVPKSTDERKKV